MEDHQAHKGLEADGHGLRDRDPLHRRDREARRAAQELGRQDLPDFVLKIPRFF
jgi:hypothetical protein